TVARLAPEKDLATLLRAVALVPPAALWLVGYGSEEESLRDLARQLGLIDRVVFWGQRADIPDLLQAADVFALSSLSEGLSMALIEAAACGLPIVATDVGGNREIVQPPHAGRLVPPQDPRALATALDEILSDEALRKTLSANARQTAVDRFSVAAMVERYRMLYEMALRRHSSS
ncbi:MAG: glycosyltransferase, partial [Verrucomicrobiae bacterium]|nr:glycosyltransferase [Verrucomicrobiae bacterium]